MNNDPDDLIERLLSIIVSKKFKQCEVQEVCFSILELCERKLLAGAFDFELWLTNTLSKLSLAGVRKRSLAAFGHALKVYLTDRKLSTLSAEQRKVNRKAAAVVLTNCLSGSKNAAEAKATSKLKWVAIAATVVMIVGFLYEFLSMPLSEPKRCHSNSKIYYGERFLYLPDKSSAIVAEGGELCFDASYGQKERRIFLSGGAYFEVATDPNNPFYIEIENVLVTVKGTGFNVNGSNGKVTVSVAHGKVSVRYKDENYDVLPGYELSIRLHDNDINLLAFDPATVDWPYPLFEYIERTSLDSLFIDFERHFHIHILCSSTVPKGCHSTGTYDFENADVNSIFRTLGIMYNLKYKIRNDTVFVTGGECFE